ncbi:MAG TPA: DUF3105 domain-containing protein, partial [Polyangiaceae bacterium]|nr:DUF3105 domain-containing protein [Polyangiaceae bacterium]
RVALAFLPIFLVACSGKGKDASSDATVQNGYCGAKTPMLIAAAGDSTDPVAPVTEEPVDGSTCNAVERSYPPPASRNHVALCSLVEYDTNPPSGGDHYPLWPQYRVYDYAIPREFYVHSLEHGGIVMTYSCDDCGSEVDQAKAIVADTEPADACCTAAGCPSGVSNQLVLTPDPGISTRWAASAWEFTLTADCFEPDVFANFIAEHRDSGVAPELVCDNSAALDVTKPMN